MTNATMIKIELNAKTNRAIDRCKEVHPKVKCAGANTFHVSGSKGGYYIVAVSMPKAGFYLASCDCKAGVKGQTCYHVIAALTVARGVRRAATEARWTSARRASS